MVERTKKDDINFEATLMDMLNSSKVRRQTLEILAINKNSYVREIAEKVSTSSRNVSQSLRSLEEWGLVRKSSKKLNKVYWKITGKGIKLWKSFNESQQRFSITSIIDNIDDSRNVFSEELKRVNELLSKINKELKLCSNTEKGIIELDKEIKNTQQNVINLNDEQRKDLYQLEIDKQTLQSQLGNRELFIKRREYLMKRKIELSTNLSKLNIMRNQLIMADPDNLIEMINNLSIPKLEMSALTKDEIQLELLEMERKMKSLRDKLEKVEESPLLKLKGNIK